MNTTDEKVGMNTVSHTQDEVSAREIEVEDPVNFLNLQEKQEYMLAHQDTIARGEIPLDKLSELTEPQKEAQASYSEMKNSLVPPRDDIFDEADEVRIYDNRKPDLYAVEEEAGRDAPRHDLQHKPEHAERTKSERRASYERRAGTVNAKESREVEEVRYRDYDDRSSLEKGLQTAVKLGLVIIVLLLLSMVFFWFLPSIKRAIGAGEGTETAGAMLTFMEENLSANQPAGGTQEPAGQTQTTPSQESEEPAGTPATNPDARTVTVTEETLNLRDLPGWMEGSKVISVAQKGEVLTVIGEEDGWLKINYNGQELYCSAEYVE